MQITPTGFTIASLAVLAALPIAPTAHADDIITVIDFEEFAEDTAITTQYEALGVTFSIDGDPKSAPIIVQEGTPIRAFSSPSDQPLASGARGLTDPRVGNDPLIPASIRIAFDPPVTSVSFYAADVDSGGGIVESLASTAFDGETIVDSDLIVGTPANNGRNTLVTLAGPAITSVLVEPSGTGSGDIGWALDFIVLTRACDVPECTPRLRVAQESAPGAGDFAANIVGTVPLWVATGSTPAAFYGYNIPEGDSWNGGALTPVAQRSHVLGAITAEGPTLFIVHDRAIPDDPDGGRAETSYLVENDPDGAAIVLRDDPDDVGDDYTGEPGDSFFTAVHRWSPCCTDGLAIGGLDCSAIVTATFTNVDASAGSPSIEGLEEWVVYGANGDQLALALEEDRRTRLEFLPPGSCPADFTCDGIVDGSDLTILLGAWGSTFGAPDINGSGQVDGADLATLLGFWGPCQ